MQNSLIIVLLISISLSDALIILEQLEEARQKNFIAGLRTLANGLLPSFPILYPWKQRFLEFKSLKIAVNKFSPNPKSASQGITKCPRLYHGKHRNLEFKSYENKILEFKSLTVH